MQITRRKFLTGAGLAAVGLAGCDSDDGEAWSAASQSEGTGETAEEAEPEDLVITESGWSASEDGYTHYGFGLQNPNGGYEAQYADIAITGYDAEGNVLFNEDQTLRVVFPQETVYYGFQAGNGVAPETVEFTVGDCTWVESEGIPETVFEISNTTETDEGYVMVSYAGNITCNYDVDTENYPDFDQTAVTVILRNDAGEIVFGDTTFIDTPEQDVATAFEISAYSVPAHASYEIYAQLW